jgi:cyclase
MTRFLLILICLCFATKAGFTQKKKSKPSGNFVLEQLAPGVWAAIHNDQYGRAICNAGIVDLGDKTLVFDPFMTPQAAKELRTVAEELTQRPVTLVINSHFHNDHIRGNQEFTPIATIISSTYTRDLIARMEPEQQEWERHHAPALLKATKKIYNSATGIDREELPLWIGYYEGMMESIDNLTITLPDIVFNDSLWIMGSKLSVKLVEYKNCHTGSDVALLIPSERVAFLGDLLFVRRHPWMADGEPGSWQASLKQLYDDQSITTYVPGHGPVCDKTGLKSLQDYFDNLQQLASSAVADSTQSQLLTQPIPKQYQNWYFSRFYQSNVKFLLSAAKQ